MRADLGGHNTRVNHAHVGSSIHLQVRADDTAEAIARRLELYHTETRPLLDYFGDLVVSIDGVGSIDEVQQRAQAALNR